MLSKATRLPQFRQTDSVPPDGTRTRAHMCTQLPPAYTRSCTAGAHKDMVMHENADMHNHRKTFITEPVQRQTRWRCAQRPAQ